MKIPERYRKRLMGLIPVDRIVTWQIPRPPKALLQELLSYDGLTPTLSDILDSMGIAGAIPGSVLKPVLSGKKIAGPAVTLKYVPEPLDPGAILPGESQGQVGRPGCLRSDGARRRSGHRWRRAGRRLGHGRSFHPHGYKIWVGREYRGLRGPGRRGNEKFGIPGLVPGGNPYYGEIPFRSLGDKRAGGLCRSFRPSRGFGRGRRYRSGYHPAKSHHRSYPAGHRGLKKEATSSKPSRKALRWKRLKRFWRRRNGKNRHEVRGSEDYETACFVRLGPRLTSNLYFRRF